MITFKLETDEEILSKKVNEAFSSYSSDFIIGNLLQNRFFEIYIFEKNGESERITIDQATSGNGKIEKLLVEGIIKRVGREDK